MVLISELLKEFGDKRIPYARLLETKEWDLKRSVIIQRDGEECTCCHNQTTEYLNGKHIWFKDYLVGIKQPSEMLLEKLDYYIELYGDKFGGIVSSEEDFEIVPVESTQAFELSKQHYLQAYAWSWSMPNLIRFLRLRSGFFQSCHIQHLNRLRSHSSICFSLI